MICHLFYKLSAGINQTKPLSYPNTKTHLSNLTITVTVYITSWGCFVPIYANLWLLLNLRKILWFLLELPTSREG